jgi:hypothetical protein
VSYVRAAAGYVEAMCSGGKAGLRPIHDARIRPGRSMGADVKVCPCRTIVPRCCNNVSARIKPSTRPRIAHRFAFEAVDDATDAANRWFAIAYMLDSRGQFASGARAAICGQLVGFRATSLLTSSCGHSVFVRIVDNARANPFQGKCLRSTVSATRQVLFARLAAAPEAQWGQPSALTRRGSSGRTT